MTKDMIYQPTTANFLAAKKILQRGGVVVFPTETVYGLGGNALDPKAIHLIFQTKNRPADNPLIVHVGSRSDIKKYADIENTLQKKVIDMLMPGPITIVLPKKDAIPDIVTAGSPMVAIRIPSNTVAEAFLKAVEMPIAAPSANPSTKPSPTSAEMVQEMLGDNVPMIFDGGKSEVGIESTVIMVPDDKHITILRPGIILKEDLEAFAGGEVKVRYAKKPSEHSPGNRYKHYSPKALVHKITTMSDLKKLITSKGNIGLIATKEFIAKHEKTLGGYGHLLKIYQRGTEKNLVSCAKNLFHIYHTCDQQGIEEIAIQELPMKGIGYAIMNRVDKSIAKQ